jgi:hypothetical protein
MDRDPVLWNRNYLLRFRFLLLKSYGSGSNFKKFGFGSGSGSYFSSYLDHKKPIF